MICRKVGSKQERLESWRQKFLSGLQSEGLEMEDVSLSSCKHIDLFLDRKTKTKASNVFTS